MRKTTYLVLIAALFWACNPSSSEHSHDAEDGHTHDADGGHSHEESPVESAEILPAQVVAATDYSPEYIQHATNIEIIEDIKEAAKTSGVMTHEGSFGPLLFGEELKGYFLELQPGMFLSEHPHPTESIIYTVSGKWVLCSEGKRKVMEAGSIFHFGSNMPTGWEAPFSEVAYLLIFKKKPEGQGYESLVKGLREMGQDLEKQKAEGEIFYFKDLPEDHEAIKFAKSVNPYFDQMMADLAE